MAILLPHPTRASGGAMKVPVSLTIGDDTATTQAKVEVKLRYWCSSDTTIPEELEREPRTLRGSLFHALRTAAIRAGRAGGAVTWYSSQLYLNGVTFPLCHRSWRRLSPRSRECITAHAQRKPQISVRDEELPADRKRDDAPCPHFSPGRHAVFFSFAAPYSLCAAPVRR